MEKNYLTLNDINAYKKAFHLSNCVWEMVITWDYFARDTVGKQFVTAIYSVSANLGEGFGRFHKDKIKFYYYSLGSVKECFDWNEKSRVRKLITEEQYQHIYTVLQELPKEIHYLIKFTNEKLKQ